MFYRYLLNPFGWFITSLSFTVSLFRFCFNDLFIGESGMLKSPTIIGWGSMCMLYVKFLL
jgi:hypothetical protein